MTATLLRNVSWISGAFFIRQILRLGTNVVLAMIVSPAVLGIMLILNTLKTGVEQVTDVGVGQNIVFDRMGNRPKFYNTAWTIQIIRGFVLFCLFLLASPLLAESFGEAELGHLLPMFAACFIISGFATPSKFLMQRKLRVSRQVALDLTVMAIGTVTTISFALISPTAEALVWALIAHGVVGVLVGACFMNWRSLRLRIDLSIARRILTFGKWVFLASMLHFAATSFDRLYLAAVLPLTLLGVFGVAKTFSEAGFTLAARLSALIVFPMVAESNRTGNGLGIIAPTRAIGLAAAGILMGCGLAISDLVIDTLYDERYASARFMLPILFVGAWFSIFSSVNESIVYGSGLPKINAGANTVKFLWLILSVPLAFSQSGLVAALIFIGMADLPKYLFLTLNQAEYRKKFLMQDSIATILLVVSAVLLRIFIFELGLVENFLPPVPNELLTI